MEMMDVMRRERERCEEWKGVKDGMQRDVYLLKSFFPRLRFTSPLLPFPSLSLPNKFFTTFCDWHNLTYFSLSPSLSIHLFPQSVIKPLLKCLNISMKRIDSNDTLLSVWFIPNIEMDWNWLISISSISLVQFITKGWRLSGDTFYTFILVSFEIEE